MERYKNLVIMELKIPWKGGWGRVWVVENEPEYLVKSFTVILKDKAFRSKFNEVSMRYQYKSLSVTKYGLQPS